MSALSPTPDVRKVPGFPATGLTSPRHAAHWSRKRVQLGGHPFLAKLVAPAQHRLLAQAGPKSPQDDLGYRARAQSATASAAPHPPCPHSSTCAKFVRRNQVVGDLLWPGRSP